MLVRTHFGTFRYAVDHSMSVPPSDVSVLDATTDSRLTLTTCTPRYTAARRLVVVAHLVGTASPTPGAPAYGATGVGSPSRRPIGTAAGPLAGLSGGVAPRGPAIVWALVVLALVLLLWILGGRGRTGPSARRRRWIVYALGSPVMVVALFVFFENVSRLLPANV